MVLGQDAWDLSCTAWQLTGSYPPPAYGTMAVPPPLSTPPFTPLNPPFHLPDLLFPHLEQRINGSSDDLTPIHPIAFKAPLRTAP